MALRAPLGVRLRSLGDRWPEPLPDRGLIALMSVVPLIVLCPLQDTPFIDDWVYAWSVEHLLRTGDIRILDWSVSQNVVQVLWGTLFCAPFGFSFTALRLSTWVASLLGLLGLHALLRELGARRPDALLGVALVAFYPVYFILCLSFMTDVPFVTLVIWFFAALARALERRSSRALAGAALFACLAIAVRPVGIFLAGVLLLVRWPPASGWIPSRRQVMAAAAPIGVLVLLMLVRGTLTEHRADLTWIDGSWSWRLMVTPSFDLTRLATWTLENLAVVTGTLGVALVPLALGGLSRDNARLALPIGLVAAVLLIGVVFFRNGVRSPLDPQFIWSLRELGATEALVPPITTEPARSLGWAVAAMDVATLSLSLALAPLARPREVREGARGLAWGALGYFAMSTVLWLFYDRYVLPLVVIMVALRLGVAGIPRRRLAVLGVAILAAASVLGTWDHLQYNRALWAAVAWARRIGIEDRHLDGGYIVNGWLQYAHPENAARAPNGDVQVPDVNGGPPGRYGIVRHVPAESRVLHTVIYRRLLAPSGQLYVVDRGPATSTSSAR